MGRVTSNVFLASRERNVLDFLIIAGNTALRWSAGEK
jgi:hypothetical protein